MYRQKLHFFNYPKGATDEEIQSFETFITENVPEVFSEVERAGFQITIPYIRMQSVAKDTGKGGADRQLFKTIANTISMQASNNSPYKKTHQQKIFYTILKESKTYLTLIKNLKDYLKELQRELYTWNRVWYGTYLEQATATGG